MMAPLTTNTPLFTCVGAVMGAHGVHGSVLVKSFTQEAVTFTNYLILYDEVGETLFNIKSAKIHKNQIIIARFKEIKDRNEAEKSKGTLLYIPRSLLPKLEEEEYYHADLIGLAVQLKTGEKFGKIDAVHNFGAGDILEIQEGTDHKSVMIPFTAEAVPQVNIREGYIIMDPEIALPRDKAEDLQQKQEL